MLAPISILGIVIELVSATFQNLGLNLQRLAHRRQIQSREIASNFNKKINYCRNPKWFFAMFVYIFGVVLDFVALAIIPLTVTLPVGSVGIGLNCVFARFLLHEKFTLYDGIGCFLCVCGACFVIGLQVQEMDQIGIVQLREIFKNEGLWFFGSMIVIIILLFFISIFWKNAFTAGIMPGITSVFTIMFGSIIGQMTLKTLGGDNQMIYIEYWACLGALIIFLLLMNEFLQRANSKYDNMIIIPIFFTSTLLLNILSGIFFFKYLSGITVVQGVLFGVGIFLVICGCIALSINHIGIKEDNLGSLVNLGDDFVNQQADDNDHVYKVLEMI
ncbi:Magnesium transporter NIPA [Spironucleus salmonicida]|uniref:Magnesium transporter NIPA n=1 Tax=Spironucleus salmonicida TaxID=348837 RepID=V6LS81_9EUKA|nr:Magnesium transporter NIPA [Spironucleus salmonicida]|eukprot:EST46551.1 Transmembrane domain-containing protein [Spironucleus salmonicida]